LSPHADTWANFCQAACDQRGLPLTIVRVSISPANSDGLGIEGAARRARYAAFREQGSAIILAGQHADDQAETVLHQLLRGTGLAGLAAMGEARTLNPGQQLLRPLLHLSRSEIETYARARQLQWVEDESNTDTAYTRNFIRHELMPLVATRFPHYAASLRRAATHAAGSVTMLEDLAKLDLRWDGVNAHADGLDKLDLLRQTNALYYWLGWHKVSPPSHAQMEEWARQLFRESPPDKSHLAGGHDYVIRRSRNVLSLQMKSNGEGE
ncbi:MAG: tRNA lysidine(34) synthetase TilS, partial [Pseudomonadota bacterium]